MVSAFVTAPPPPALPPLAAFVATLGAHVVFAVLIAGLAVVAAVLLQHAVTTAKPARRVVLRGHSGRAPVPRVA
jgi:hypothetical protein